MKHGVQVKPQGHVGLLKHHWWCAAASLLHCKEEKIKEMIELTRADEMARKNKENCLGSGDEKQVSKQFPTFAGISGNSLTLCGFVVSHWCLCCRVSPGQLQMVVPMCVLRDRPPPCMRVHGWQEPIGLVQGSVLGSCVYWDHKCLWERLVSYDKANALLSCTLLGSAKVPPAFLAAS